MKLRRPSLLTPVLRIALGYFVAASLWIGVSDRVLVWLISDPHDLTLAQTWKGWFFVSITALLLGWLMRRELLRYSFAREALLSTQDLLAENEQRYRLVFEQSPIPMFIYQRNTHEILAANAAACQQYGYTYAEFLRLHMYDLLPGDGKQILTARLRSLIGRAEYVGEPWTHVKKDGSQFRIQAASDDLPFNGVPARLVIVRDVTEQLRAEQHMYRLAYVDTLTELFNRAGLLHDLAERLDEKANSIQALVLLDLDRFRDINDSMGHEVGDRVLIEVSRRLRDALPTSTVLARISADLFAVVQEVASLAEATTLGERLTEVLDAPVILDAGRNLRLTACVGVALAPDHGADKETLLRNAETALHSATSSGRESFAVYRDAMNAAALERLALEADLRHALSRNEFTLLYQPQIARNGRVIGVEALLRWNHPTRGLVPPNTFIPIAENCGLIVAIGTWVIESACRQGKMWCDAGLGSITVAVNLSALQFREANLVRDIAAILDATGFPAQNLELEVTESVIMTDVDEVTSILLQLRAMGIQLAIDDFGTGYSSLAYLRQLALTKLKIDQSFVRTLPSDENASAIATTIIALGKSLHMTVIAEGVENEAQADFLHEIGCDEMQGFLYSRPLPADQIDRFVRNALYR